MLIMGILTKEVEVMPSGKNIQYYRDLGYDVKWHVPLMVKTEDLPLCSTIYVETECDYCGKRKPLTTYQSYNEQTKNGMLKCCCADCAHIKRKESMIAKYGYGTPMQSPEMKSQIQQTNLRKYGSKSPLGNCEVQKKVKATMQEKYGVDSPLQSKIIREKMENTFLANYGVKNCMLNSELKEKIKRTNLERYGVENPLLNKEIQDKKNATLMNKYGTIYPLQNDNCYNKLIETNLSKYGVVNISQLDETKQKVKQTNLERYGCENPMQNPDILEKWFAENGSDFVKSSLQQQYLCSLYNGILNYPFKCFALDIYIPNERLNVEYDGSGHRMSVYFGSMTNEEFETRTLYRNIAIKDEGYKQMRIISLKDLLPCDSILYQMLEYTKEYFSLFPDHSWIEFNIDTSSVRNTEHKDGVFYHYGDLRKIKKSDINDADVDSRNQ